jgi:hypothetical protein
VNLVLFLHTLEGGASSIPVGSGLLDRPVKPGDDMLKIKHLRHQVCVRQRQKSAAPIQRTQSKEKAMCSYIIEKTAVSGSAKGANGWMRIDTANVYFDHPYHAPLDHALAIDFVCEADGAKERVAVELSAESARALVKNILAALASGEAAHMA